MTNFRAGLCWNGSTGYRGHGRADVAPKTAVFLKTCFGINLASSGMKMLIR